MDHVPHISMTIRGRLMILRYSGAFSADNYQTSSASVVEMVRQPGVQWRVLSDVRCFRPASVGEMPGLIAAHAHFLRGNADYVYRSAVLAPVSATGKVLINQGFALVKGNRKNLRLFDSEHEAMAWLRQA